MPRRPIPTLVGLIIFALGSVSVQVAQCSSDQDASRGTLIDQDPTTYFPKGIEEHTDFYSKFLNLIGEPSLMAESQETSAESYRLICMFCQYPGLLVVRLQLRPDGSGAVTTVLSTIDVSGQVTVGDKAARMVGAPQVKRFLASIEWAHFWSMPSTKPQTSNLPRYDAALSQWVVEGVRSGTYHAVFREGPEPNRFTDMVLILTKDLANLSGAAVPRPMPSR
jgi:hypothetical protein